MKLTDLARGEPCMIRIPGICNHNPETTVAAHYRLAGLCGVGTKPLDILSAHACHECHQAVDQRAGTDDYTRFELRLAHAEAVLRTIDKLVREGRIEIRVKG